VNLCAILRATLWLKMHYTKEYHVHLKGAQRVKTILPDTYYSARMKKDGVFLTRAIEIASNGISEGGGPSGAIIVKDDKIIAEAYNRVALNNDLTSYAEILDMRQASLILKSHELNNSTLYCSCEPCPMCIGAIYSSGITKVVYSIDRTYAERAGFSDKLIYNEISPDSSERKISFIRLTDFWGNEIFREWDEPGINIRY
jgi:guanine deaminase